MNTEELKNKAYQLMNQNAVLMDQLTESNYAATKKAINDNRRIINDLIKERNKIKGYTF